MLKTVKVLLTSLMLLSLYGCAASAPRLAAPTTIVAPQPIEDSTGAFVSPFTSDDVVAEWVAKAMNAKAGSAVGGYVGAKAGQKAMENIPFIGGWLGQKAGSAAGRAVALKAVGGMEFIKETSDLSFNTADELAVFMYAKHSTHPKYAKVLSATQEIYPEMKLGYYKAIQRASRAR